MNPWLPAAPGFGGEGGGEQRPMASPQLTWKATAEEARHEARLALVADLQAAFALVGAA